VVSFRLALSNPTLPEITDGYEIQLHHILGHDQHFHAEVSLLQNSLCDDKERQPLLHYVPQTTEAVGKNGNGRPRGLRVRATDQ
ncbi:hypothetical protein, partial [Shinella sp. BE166]|uniref:hypothetical protein n=1 Tax=Shinella sp. BE166 TaxID=3373918 RepID=UPI003EC0E1CD